MFSLNCTILPIILILFAQTFLTVIAKNDTLKNGRTYFVQLKNVGDGETMYRSPWRKNLSSKYSKSIDEYEIVGRLVQSGGGDELDKNEKSLHVLDETWNTNAKTSVNDYPDVISDFYDAMNKNEAHKINNATELRFLFEVDATDNEIFKFNMDDLDIANDTIIDAELYIYRHQNEKYKNPESAHYVARLYQITDNITNAELSREKSDVHRLLNVVYISSIADGWQIFKVKTAIDNWLNNDENLGFLVTFKDNAEKLIDINFAHKNTSNDEYQAFVVLYLKDNKFEKSIQARDVSSKNCIKKFQSLQSGEIPCSRHIWYINFHELGWNKFLLEPRGYMAYRCKGSCKSSLYADYSNYGKMLNIYKQNSDEFSGPACVPTVYKPLLIMYIDNNNKLIIKYYEDMIVDKCGCR